ncbi:MAG TPA: GGDEF domain-containing protein [Candidatus Acidoferrales bacterium]|nr:GGDEF domain-containing protein [Candidatus Acidoferrales bacterium]
MSVALLGLSWASLFAAAAGLVAVDRRRDRRLLLRMRLLEAREDGMRRVARELIAASRESPTAVCEALDRAVRALSPAIDVALFAERDGEALRCTYTSGQRAEYFQEARLPLDDQASALAQAALKGHRVASFGLQKPLIPGDRAFLAVPMVEDATTIGVFYVASTTVDSFDVEESIVTLVDLAVSAYQLALDREIDRERATIDALTGLLTPRAFRTRLYDTAAEVQHHPDAHLALLFIDTDHFKSCNDTLGHAAGDVILRALAQIFAANAGSESIVGRNGGDEFCILLAGVTKTEAIRRAERIRRAVENYPFEAILDGQVPRHAITTSIGVSAYPTDAKDAQLLLETADAAMYHSKKRGRNRVSFYDLSATLTDLGDEPFVPGNPTFDAVEHVSALVPPSEN